MSIWIEVTLPDWILLTHWMANMRMCGCGPRAYTEFTCTHPHRHTRTHSQTCMHARKHARTDTHTPHRHTHVHAVDPCSNMNRCLWLNIKRHFFSHLLSQLQVTCGIPHVKSNHMCFSDRCWVSKLSRLDDFCLRVQFENLDLEVQHG